jgi:transposase
MRFVASKTEDQQVRGVLFRCRDRLVRHRTELINALRAILYEFGLVVPKGIAHLKRIEELVGDTSVALPTAIRKECQDLLGKSRSGRLASKKRPMPWSGLRKKVASHGS